jgi:hypothetical protein
MCAPSHLQLSVPCRPGTHTYMLQAKSKGKACTHALPHATEAPGPTSRLRKGYDTTTCPRLWNPPLCLGGLRHCHVPRGSGPCLTIQEGSDNTTHPLALDPASSPRRALALACVLQLRTAPTSEVGSNADTCPMALRRPWAVEIKEGLAAMACSQAHVFPRHAHTLPRHLQDVRAVTSQNFYFRMWMIFLNKFKFLKGFHLI